MLIEIDISDDELFDRQIAEHRAAHPGSVEVYKKVQHGPAGGNPMYHLGIFDAAGLAWLSRVYFGEEPNQCPVAIVKQP